MGCLHAETIGQKPLSDRIRGRLGPVDPKPTQNAHLSGLVNNWGELAEVSHSRPGRGYKSELKHVARLNLRPGPFLAFSHGDACPGNDVFRIGRWGWLDLENCGYHHALLDGMAPRMYYPTCWCVRRIPDRILNRMESAYRKALIPGCPEAADDQIWGRVQVEACAHWAQAGAYIITSPAELLSRGRSGWQKLLGIKAGDPWHGVVALRRRNLCRMKMFARMSRQYNHLPALGETAFRIAQYWTKRWSTETHEMPLYRASGGPDVVRTN